MHFMNLLRTKWLRWCLAFVALGLVLLALAWAALPGVLKSQAELRGSEALGRKVTVGAIEFTPWTLELAVTDIRIASADGASSQVEIARIYLDAELQSVLRLAPVLDAFTVEAPRIRLTHLGGGRLDIDDVLAHLKPAPDSPPSAPLRFALYNLVLSDGSVDLVDQRASGERQHSLRKLNLAVPFFSNLESQRDVNVQPRLAFELNGSSFDTAAQTTPFAVQRKGEATLQIAKLDLAPYLPYLPSGLPLQLKSAVLDSTLKLQFAQADKSTLAISGDIRVSDILLAQGKSADVLTVASIKAEITDLRPLEKRLDLKSIAIDAPRLQVVRDTAGNIPLLSALGATSAPPKASNAAVPATAFKPTSRASAPMVAASGPAQLPGTGVAAASPAWQVTLASLNLRQGAVGWTDDAVPGGARLAVSGTEVQVNNIRWPLADAKAAGDADAKSGGNVAGNAAISFEGQAFLGELRAVKATQVAKAAAVAQPAKTTEAANAPPVAGTGTANAIQAVQVSAAPTGAARISLRGEGSAQTGSTTVTLSDLGLKLLAPYVGQFLVPRVEGVLGGEALATWNNGALAVNVQRLALEKFALTPPEVNPGDITARELPKIGLLEVRDARIDLTQKTMAVSKLRLQTAVVRLQRENDGQWMFGRWLKKPAATAAPGGAVAAPPIASLAPGTAALPAGSAAVAANPAPAASWSATVAEIGVDDSNLVFVDRVPAKRVALEMQALKLQALSFSPDGKKPMPVTLSAKIRSARNDAGTLAFNGSVMWDPLVVQGAVDATQVPLHTVAPYFASGFNLELLRAEANFKGQFGFTQMVNGPTLRVQGDASVDDLLVKSELGVQKGGTGEPTTDELLNWKLLSVPGIDLTMVPGTPLRLKVRELTLSDFYARLIINAQGRLVLQDIVRPTDAAGTVTADGAAAGATPGAPAATSPAAAASAPAIAKAEARSPFIEIGPIRIINGHVAFSDRFIRPNYSADLTELNGTLSQFASQTPEGVVQMADLELRGLAEGTAGLEIVGKVNPLAKPLALDVRGKVRDLELSPLSSYAIKYAGYGIERGRLSVDVNYVIRPDGQLSADNKITLTQLTFGDKVEGGLSNLPVKLAVSLLSDRDGVIDLDLPISGSLNDPQFRIWPVVWKIIGNLITKALTSPFSLFSGSSGSGSESLSAVAFDPGTATISSSATTGLDTVARAMRDKTAMQMTITGSAGLEQERDAIKRERLNAMVLLEKRRMVAETGGDVAQVKAVTEADYPAVLKEVYRRSDIKKPRNMVGLRKDLPVPEMEALLLTSIAVNEDTVRELARRRGVVVREYLTAQTVPSSRLFLGAAKVLPPDATQKPQVDLSLTNN